MPGLNRSVIANIESGRRGYVTIEEALLFAFVLDVAPVHLLVPTETPDVPGDARYQATPAGLWLTLGAARAWLRGDWCPPSGDPRTYWSEVPSEEFRPPRPPDDEAKTDQSERVSRRRELVDEVRKAQARWSGDPVED